MLNEFLVIATGRAIDKETILDLALRGQEGINLDPVVIAINLFFFKLFVHFEMVFLVIQSVDHIAKVVIRLLQSTLVREQFQCLVKELVWRDVLLPLTNRWHQQLHCLVDDGLQRPHVMLVAQVKHQTSFHSTLIGVVIFNIHEGFDFFHLIFVLARLLLANVVVRVVVGLLSLFHVRILQRVVDVVNHDLVLDLDVVLETD